MTRIRYDGLAEWYDDEQARIAQRADAPLARYAQLVGSGAGLLLEIGCGTGLTAQLLESSGWSVVGLDLSADQLSIARGRCTAAVRGDAHALPVRSASVAVIGLAFVHTDVDAFDRVMREVARVLRPGGRVAYLGVHPCFVGPHVDSPTKSDERLGLVPGYRDGGWTDESEQFGPGIRDRVGARHVPLGEYLMAFAAAGLVLDGITEAGDGIVPWMLEVEAHRPD